nr:hypothetical protein [Tanacetum cinerariifolium]
GRILPGLRFGVEYSDQYDNGEAPILFRQKVFSSSLDGKKLIGKTAEDLIESERFYRLHDEDAVNLCCVGILQLVLLGVEDRRQVPNWILRLSNDRNAWDKYPWGSYVWPTLYSQLKDANPRRWDSFYATKPRRRVDSTYSIFEFTSAFMMWIVESFRVVAENYYERHRRHSRVVAWSLKGRFFRRMVREFFHNLYEVPSEFYQEFDEQKRAIEAQKKVVEKMIEKEDERKQTYEEMHRKRREQRPSIYLLTPFMELPPIIVLPKKHSDRAKNKVKNANLSLLNLGNAFANDNVGDDDVMFLGRRFTGNYLCYDNVDRNKADRGRQLAMMNLAHEFNDTCSAKDELHKAYEECRDIPME